jgi:DNA-binding NarL/FixJ family response regulator
VLDLLVQGCRNKEIAGQLSIRTRTVKQHFTNAFSACRDPGWSQELA